ncbi:MAG: hypothetical protein H6713_27910 [Myxococcales bacterium]|nr:hypothetical protein [Myxococcales bacterium]
MRGYRRLCATLLALGVLSCYPELPGATELHALTPIAIHVEVITSGNLDVPTTIDGRTRGELLPGDIVRLSPVLADEGGPVDPESLEINWYVCAPVDIETWLPVDCFETNFLGGPGLPDCPAGAFVGVPSSCRVGAGAAAEFLFAPPYSVAMAQDLASVSVTMIARDPSLHAESCEARLSADAGADISDCAIQTRRVELGPLGPLIDALDALEYVDRDDYLDALWSVEPNLNPVVPAFLLRELDSGETRLVAPRGRVTVAPRQRFSLEPVIDERDLQPYVFLNGIPETEFVNWGWRVTPPAEVLSVHARLSSEPLELAAPREPGASFYVFLQLREGRGSVVGEWLRVDVAS